MKLVAISIIFFSFGSTICSADSIEGLWKRPNGILVNIANCGKSFCVSAASGPHNGGKAGTFQPDGRGGYIGRLTDLETGKTYDGKGIVRGNSATLSGCIFFGLLCQSETWARQ